MWEYKTIKLAATGFWGGGHVDAKLDALLNNLGAENWELASAFDTNNLGSTSDIMVIFKRPKQ